MIIHRQGPKAPVDLPRELVHRPKYAYPRTEASEITDSEAEFVVIMHHVFNRGASPVAIQSRISTCHV